MDNDIKYITFFADSHIIGKSMLHTTAKFTYDVTNIKDIYETPEFLEMIKKIKDEIILHNPNENIKEPWQLTNIFMYINNDRDEKIPIHGAFDKLFALIYDQNTKKINIRYYKTATDIKDIYILSFAELNKLYLNTNDIPISISDSNTSKKKDIIKIPNISVIFKPILNKTSIIPRLIQNKWDDEIFKNIFKKKTTYIDPYLVKSIELLNDIQKVEKKNKIITLIRYIVLFACFVLVIGGIIAKYKYHLF